MCRFRWRILYILLLRTHWKVIESHKFNIFLLCCIILGLYRSCIYESLLGAVVCFIKWLSYNEVWKENVIHHFIGGLLELDSYNTFGILFCLIRFAFYAPFHLTSSTKYLSIISFYTVFTSPFEELHISFETHICHIRNVEMYFKWTMC